MGGKREMILHLIQQCLLVLTIAILVSITLILLGIIAYFTAGMLISLIHAFRKVQAKNTAKHLFKTCNKISETAEQMMKK